MNYDYIILMGTSVSAGTDGYINSDADNCSDAWCTLWIWSFSVCKMNIMKKINIILSGANQTCSVTQEEEQKHVSHMRRISAQTDESGRSEGTERDFTLEFVKGSRFVLILWSFTQTSVPICLSLCLSVPMISIIIIKRQQVTLQTYNTYLL